MELFKTGLPLPHNAHAAAVLFLTAFALILFTREKVLLESSGFLVLIAPAVGFELFHFKVDGRVLHAVGFSQVSDTKHWFLFVPQ